MSPLLSVHDLIDTLLVDFVHASDVALSPPFGEKLSDIQDLGVRQDRHSVVCSDHWFKPALAHLVIDVFLICAKEKVVRICATWRIAAMQNVHAFRNRATVKEPREAVCLTISSAPVQTTIAFRANAAGPYPAAGLWDANDERFKPFRIRDRLALSHGRASFSSRFVVRVRQCFNTADTRLILHA